MKNIAELEKEEGFLFAIYDYAHLNMLLSAMAMLSLIFLFGILQVIGVVDSSVYTGMSRASFVLSFSTIGLFFLSIKVYKLIKIEKRRILFFKDKLVRTSNNQTIYLKDVEDILSLSDFLLFGDAVNPNKFKKINHSILMIILMIPVLIIFTILIAFPMIILNIFRYRKFIITKKIIPLNWNDELSVPIVYPLPNQEEQKKVEEYFKVYLNTDIKTLKTRFI